MCKEFDEDTVFEKSNYEEKEKIDLIIKDFEDLSLILRFCPLESAVHFFDESNITYRNSYLTSLQLYFYSYNKETHMETPLFYVVDEDKELLNLKSILEDYIASNIDINGKKFKFFNDDTLEISLITKEKNNKNFVKFEFFDYVGAGLKFELNHEELCVFLRTLKDFLIECIEHYKTEDEI